jgi:2-methylcitrate dehydratase PrpD
MDAIYPLIQHAHSFDGGALSRNTVAITKRFIFDAIAVMIAGSRAQGCAEVARYVSQWSGKPDALIVTGARVPAPYAAMVNSMMAHAVEFDDTYEPADVHGYAVVLPAVLAGAELPSAGRVNGLDFIAAVAIGVDIAYRLGSAIRTYRGWQPTSTCGNLGAAFATARLARCTKEQMHHALGIAYALVAGNFQAVVDASLTKRLQPGFSARAAVEAVLLAQSGITGAKDVLEGTFGFYRLYEAGEYNADVVTADLGTRFLTDRASMKPYPCCRFCHAAIDAALLVTQDEGWPAPRTADIKAVEVDIPAETYDYVGKPYALGSNPVVAAQFSVPYTVASALSRRKAGLAEFSPSAVMDKDVVAVADRVVAKPVSGSRYDAVSVRVALKSGRTFEKRVATMKGEPDNPLSDTELREKAKTCIQYGRFPDRAVDDLFEWADGLDRAEAPLPALHSIFMSGAAS